MPRQNKFKESDSGKHNRNGGTVERFTAEYKRYIYCDLPAADKRKLRELAPNGESILEWAFSMPSSGYKLSVAPSKDGSSVTAQLFCSDREHKHAGYILSSFGTDVITALTVLWYKHTQVLKNDWFTLEPEDDESDFG